MESSLLLRRIRFLVAVFIVGLALSGITAFPLVWEIRLLARFFGLAPDADPADYTGLTGWIANIIKTHKNDKLI